MAELSNVNSKIPYYKNFWMNYFPNRYDENSAFDTFNFVAISILNTTFDNELVSNNNEMFMSGTILRILVNNLISLKKFQGNIDGKTTKLPFFDLYFVIYNEVLILMLENINVAIIIGNDLRIKRLFNLTQTISLDIRELATSWDKIFLNEYICFSFYKKGEYQSINILNHNLIPNFKLLIEKSLKINLQLFISTFDLINQYTAYIATQKKTELYSNLLRITPDYLVIIPEFRNEIKTQWGLYIAKMIKIAKGFNEQ